MKTESQGSEPGAAQGRAEPIVNWDVLVEGIPACLVGGGFLGGAGILGWQALYWLKTGLWHPVPVSLVLDWAHIEQPSVEWIGAQKLIDKALDLPLSLVLFALPMLLVWLLVWIIVGYLRR
jgi:hypothetical protein